MKRVVHAACPHDCPDACGVLITVEDGRATKIQGDPAHPVTRGFLCAKVAKYLDRVYSPERVLFPMRRVGKKGHAGEGFAGESPATTQASRQSSVVGRQGETGGSPVSTQDQRLHADKNVRATTQEGLLHADKSVRATQANPAQAFERISWNEALDEITERFRQIADQFGPEAILPYSYGGTLGVLNGGSMDRRFFHRLGASQLDRTICSTAGEAGLRSVLGVKLGTEPEQFRHSRYIIAWGANIHGNNIHLWPFIEEARRKGAKFVVIDPYKTRTAACADWHLPINMGTDAALALGMMHVIIGEGLYDADYVANYTLGFDQLREKVKDYPLDRVAQWTGISVPDIIRLAREYATTRPAVIRLNYGVQRSEVGGMSTRAVAFLPCITGSWKEVGGGLQLSTSGAYGLSRDAIQSPELMNKALGRPARVVNMVELGKALNTLGNPPIKALFVYNSNPAAVCPNHNEVVQGLMRPDLFTVVHEQFLTDTTDYADIVLPATTFFEHKDLQTGYGHYYLQMSQQAIEPLGECRSNVEVFRALGERMGFRDECFRESVDEMIEKVLDSPNPWLQGIDRERLEREGHVRLNFSPQSSVLSPQENRPRSSVVGRQLIPNGESPVATRPDIEPFLPFAKGGFQTLSGKAELYSEELKHLGLDPVAEFRPPTESRHSDKARTYPLEMLARKADNFLNSTFSNLPAVQKMEDRDLLEISSADAQRRGIADGDAVRVFNGRGEIRLTARVNGQVQPGTVSARLNWAKLTPGGRNINVLTSEKLSDMGNSATFYSVLVEVERIQPAHENRT